MHTARHCTIDRAMSDVLIVEQLGPKRYRTPEGYLYCEDVPAARTGEMVYGAGEIPLKPGKDNVIRVMRDAKALFAPTTLASYNGKPVIDDHPDKYNLSATNWRVSSRQIVGTTLNPRRGEGDDSDVMLVDLLIMDAAAIRDIEAGKVEVSAGYEADYEQTGPGTGRQANIIGNHIALVERGRCGPRCAIGDHQPKELSSMANLKKRRAIMQDAARRVFKDAEEAFMQAIGDPAAESEDEPDGDEGEGEGHTHIHIHADGGEPAAAGPAAGAETQDDPVEARFQAIEATLAQIMSKLGGGKLAAPAPAGDAAPGVTPEKDGPADSDALAGGDGDGDDLMDYQDAMPEELLAAKTGDSAALNTSFKAVLADAEVLVPGFRLPTFDAKLARRVTLDGMCALRRDVLRSLAQTTDGATLLDLITGSNGPDFAKAPCITVASTFRAAAGAKRLVNNTAATGDARRLPAHSVGGGPVGITSISQLNAMHRSHYAGKAAH